MTIRCDEFCRCYIVEVRDRASEVTGEAQDGKYANQLAVVRRGEGTFEVKVAKDNILLVGVSDLHTKAEVSDRPRARAVCPESLFFRAEDLASLDVVRSQGYDTSGPKLIKSIG